MAAFIFRFLVRHPKLCFALTLGAHFVLLLVTGSLYLSGYDILPADFSQVPLNLEHDVTKLRADAWKFVRQDSRVNINPTSVGIQAERSIQYRDLLELMYEDENGNVFTKENLQLISDTEIELLNNSIYQQRLCQSITHGLCKLPLSVVRFFDGSYRGIHPALYDPNFDNITGILSLANSMNETRAILDFHLDKHAVIDSKDNKPAISRYTRSLFYIGYPLEGFHNTEDRAEEQWDKMQVYASEAFAESLNEKFHQGIGSMRFYYFLQALFFNAISQQVIYDLLLAGASFTFIFLFMLFQTQSLWITGWAVFSILTCFFGANLIYRLILDCRYIGIFHVLSVFIILGIGADDVFVFIDTWNSSEVSSFRDLASRVSFVYKRAATAMFTTSFTTMVAFITSVFSPLLGVSTFGIFSALLVFVNYCSVIIFFPTVIITYEFYWKDYRWHCFGDLKAWQLTSRQDATHGIPQGDDEQERPLNDDKYVEPSKLVSKFLEGDFFENFIAHKTIRWIILAVFVVFVSVSIGFATQLTPDEEPVDVWGPGTNWYVIKGLRRSAFRPSQEDDVVEVNIIWGLRNQDRSSCHFTDFKCKGRTVFDPTFDLNPTLCQEALLELCQEIKTLPMNELKKRRIRRNAVSGEPEIQCFMERLSEYLKDEVTKPQYSNETVLTIPSDEESVRFLMERNPQLFNVTMIGATYDRYFEVMLGYWLTHANQSVTSYDYKIYGGLLGGSMDPTNPSSEPNYQGGQYGNKLLFASIVVNTTMVLSKTGHTEGLKVYQHWEDFVQQKMKSMPPTCNNAFQATPNGHNAWHWLKVKKVLASTAVRGILLGLGLAILLLVVMTSNWIVGLLCGAIISCVTVGVVGVIPLAGWKLGVLESLNLTLVVGLAVDYVVHLADGYVRSQKHSRREKVRETLGHVGISVLSGASTTLGASVFMLAAKILFFFQFGIFMFCTIGLSILYALILFTTILGIFGPEGETGSLTPIVKWLKKKIGLPIQEGIPCDDFSGPHYQSPTIHLSQTATPL